MDPLVDLRKLELPEPAHPVSGQALGLDPSVDRVLGHAQMAGDFVNGNPGFWH